MKAIIVFLSSLFFASCMHMGMPMTDMTHQGHRGGSSIEKELLSGDIRGVATIPPLTAGRPAVLTLRLSDRTSGKPLTGAEVLFQVDVVEQGDSRDHHAAQHQVEKSEDSSTMRDVIEGGEPGLYTVSYTPLEGETQDFRFHIVAVDKKRLDPALVIETRRAADGVREHERDGMMMGAGPSTGTYLIIGGVLMTALMIFMMVR